VKWGEAKTLLVRGEGICKITFTNTSKEATLRKCFYILELGLNIISVTALPPDILWIGRNNTLVITKNNQLITKRQVKEGLYFLPV